eukprot:1230531-Prymnesium_polylepis.1
MSAPASCSTLSERRKMRPQRRPNEHQRRVNQGLHCQRKRMTWRGAPAPRQLRAASSQPSWGSAGKTVGFRLGVHLS